MDQDNRSDQTTQLPCKIEIPNSSVDVSGKVAQTTSEKQSYQTSASTRPTSISLEYVQDVSSTLEQRTPEKDPKSVRLSFIRQTKSSNDTTAAADNEEPTPAEEGMTISNPPRNKWRVISLFCYISLVGCLDSSPGALLPRIEEYYHINYTLVSLIWLGNALGFITIGLVSFKLEEWMSKRQLMCCGSLFQIMMFALVAPGTHFVVVVIGFYFGGLGSALALSQHNIFLSKFKNASRLLGYYHGSYGIGATICPIIATAMVDAGVRWSYFYLILLGLVSANFINQWMAFKFANDDLTPWYFHDKKKHDLTKSEPNSTASTPENEIDRQLISVNDEIAPSKASKAINIEEVNLDDNGNHIELKSQLSLSLRHTLTWVCAFWVLCYQGGEVAFPGFLLSYIEDYRGGSKTSSGYIISGFWGGLTIGRFFLVSLYHKYIGDKRGVTIMIVGSLICLALIWVIPFVIVEAIFAALCGSFVGPMIPLMLTVATRVLPVNIQFISMTIMSAFGSSGGAFFPFIVGLISQHAGAVVVLPISIALFVGTGILWFMLPNPDRDIVNHYWQRLW